MIQFQEGVIMTYLVMPIYASWYIYLFNISKVKQKYNYYYVGLFTLKKIMPLLLYW